MKQTMKQNDDGWKGDKIGGTVLEQNINKQ